MQQLLSRSSEAKVGVVSFCLGALVMLALSIVIFAFLVESGCAVRGDREELPTLKRRRLNEAKAKATPIAHGGEPAASSSSSSLPSLKETLGKTFLSNKLSGKDVFEISQAAVAEATAQESSSSAAGFAKAGAGGKQLGNLARDILCQLLRNSDQELFYYPVPFKDPDTDNAITSLHPFLLPHEILAAMVRQKGFGAFAMDAGQEFIYRILAKQCAKLGLQLAETLAVGLHGDGVPYTKKESLEIISFNFLNHPQGERIPLTALSKKIATTATWECVFHVVAWSMRMLFTGVVARFLPNGQEWANRHKRKQYKGDSLPCRALLLQVRADWPFLRQLFCFPSWSSRRICWKCTAELEAGSERSYEITHAGARWRQERIDDAVFLRHVQDQGGQLCPLLSLPGFSLSHVLLDWLHVVDLGVSADALGNLFWLCLTYRAGNPLMRGNSKGERLKQLWLQLKDWYKVHKPPSVLDNLTEEMVKRDGASKKPKLKAKGAECRYLMPFGYELAKQFSESNPGDRYLATIAAAFEQLFLLQTMVSCSSEPWDSAKASAHCRQFCTLYHAVQQQSTWPLWHMKPKFHLFQEMVEYQSVVYGNPRTFWAYRDESWCGYWAKASKRRGGANAASTTAVSFLKRFLAMDAI